MNRIIFLITAFFTGFCLSISSHPGANYNIPGEAGMNNWPINENVSANETIEGLLKKAETCMKEERFEDASKIFLEAYNTDKSSFSGLDYVQMAYSLRMAGNNSKDVIFYYDKAIENYNAMKSQYVEKRGKDGWIRLMRMAYFGKASVYNKNKQYEAAAKAYKDILDIYNENHVTEDLDLVYMRLGDVCMNTNAYDAAIKMYNTACKYRLMGPSNMSKRRVQKMQASADDENPSDPVLGRASYNMAMCYKELNDVDSYVTFIKRAANLGNHEAQIIVDKMPDQVLNAGT